MDAYNNDYGCDRDLIWYLLFKLIMTARILWILCRVFILLLLLETATTMLAPSPLQALRGKYNNDY